MLSLLTLTLALNSASPSPLPPAFSLPAITLKAPKAALHVDVASTEAEREYGLMNRTSLPAHTGMLFVFDRDAPLEFWMKNTLIPLDMVFVSDKGIVRSIASNVPTVPPATPDEKVPRRQGHARFVIELPANEAARDGLEPGIHIAGLPPLPLH